MNQIEYRVQSGDSLRSIARRHNIPEDVLSRLNGLSDLNPIKAGQVLRILQETPSAQRAPPQTRTERVRANDTLSRIAQRNHVTVETLAQANNIRDLDQRLVLGLPLKIPPVSGSATAQGQSAARGARGQSVPFQRKADEQQAPSPVAGGLAEAARSEKISPFGQQARPFGGTRLLVASSSSLVVANLLADARREQSSPPNQKVRYPIKVPQGLRTEEDLDRYAEVLIFGRVVGIRWTTMEWDVSAFARQGKTVYYVYSPSEVKHFGGREVSQVVRPQTRNPAYHYCVRSKQVVKEGPACSLGFGSQVQTPTATVGRCVLLGR